MLVSRLGDQRGSQRRRARRRRRPGGARMRADRRGRRPRRHAVGARATPRGDGTSRSACSGKRTTRNARGLARVRVRAGRCRHRDRLRGHARGDRPARGADRALHGLSARPAQLRGGSRCRGWRRPRRSSSPSGGRGAATEPGRRLGPDRRSHRHRRRRAARDPRRRGRARHPRPRGRIPAGAQRRPRPGERPPPAAGCRARTPQHPPRGRSRRARPSRTASAASGACSKPPSVSTPGYLLPEDTLWRSSGRPPAPAPATPSPRGRSTKRSSRAAGWAWRSERPGASPASRRVPMSASQRYPLLFSPLRLGPVTRRATGSCSRRTSTNYAEDGLPTEQHAAYYEARAAGGAGLVITEEHSVHPTDWPYEKLIHGFDPEVVPGYRAITDARAPPRHADLRPDQPQRRTGDRDVLTPAASGRRRRWRTRSSARCRRRSTSPRSPRSSTATPRWRCTAREGGLRRDRAAVLAFLDRARLPVAGDEPAHRRLRRPLGAARPAPARDPDRGPRRASGPKLAIGVRLCGDELIEGGTTIDEAVAVAQMVEEQGCADYVNTSIGVATATLYMIEASMHVPPGYASFIPSAIREAISLPVVGAGRYKDPAQAERALRAGHCDLVGVVRGQIADPDFASQGAVGSRGVDPALPVLQPGVRRAAWASTAGSGASRTRRPAARPHRARARGGLRGASACRRGGGRPGRAAGGDRRRDRRSRGARLRARRRAGRPDPPGGHGAEPRRARRPRAQSGRAVR